MAYTAPDPEQFSGMEEAYAYMAPLAAVNITLPAFVFKGPCMQLSRIIYLNQCNPGEIMKGGAQWLQLAQRYSESKEALEAKAEELAPDTWEGKDRDAFDERLDKIIGQLETIQAFAMHIGISLMAIGTMLAVMVPIMLAFATVLMGLAVACLAVRMIVPAGPIMALAYRSAAMAFSGTALATLKAMDTANGIAAQALAAFIGANMTVTWVDMAAKGNIINPANTIGSTAFSLLDGLANLAVVKIMAPGKKGGGIPGVMGGSGVNNVLAGASGAQGIYGMGTEGAPENSMTEAGVDAGKYDFIPNTFEDQAREGDRPPEWADEVSGSSEGSDPAGQA